MKKFIALLLALVMVLSMVACGEKAPEQTNAPAQQGGENKPAEGEKPAETPAGKIPVHFIVAQYSDGTGPYYEKIIAAFEDANPDIDVTLEVIGWSDLGTRINTMVSAKQAPDIYAGGSASAYLEDELVYQAKDVVSAALQEDFYATFWNNNVNPDDGNIYQIPFVASVRSLYCNKKIFDEVGLTETPKTWKQVEEYCQKITEFYNGEVYAWGIDATGTEGQTMTAYYGWNNGGGYVDADGNYIINCEGNVGAYEWAKKLYDNGWTNKSPVTELRDDMQKLVAGDKMAMLITANFFPSLYPDCELLMGEVPYNDEVQDKAISMAVQDALIFFNSNAKATEDTPEKLAAIQKFVDYMYAAEQYLPMCIQEGLLPATASGIDLLVEQDPSQAAYISILENAQFYARAKSNWSDCSTGLCDAGGKIFSGQMTVQEALDEVQAICEEG